MKRDKDFYNLRILELSPRRFKITICINWIYYECISLNFLAAKRVIYSLCLAPDETRFNYTEISAKRALYNECKRKNIKSINANKYLEI